LLKSKNSGGVKENADIELDDTKSDLCESAGYLPEGKGADDSRGFRRLPVVEGDKRLVGMLSERDVRQHFGYLAQTRVKTAMASSPISVAESETAESAAKLMLPHKIGGLPVLKDRQVVGIVTTTDLLKAPLNVVQAAGDILKQ